MRLDNLLHLIGGELKNSPSIRTFNGFSGDLSHLKRGDLFFAKDRNLIDEAIKRGAYGIVYEGWCQISDEEIAWIKTSSLQDALLRLVRFFLIKNHTQLFALPPTLLDLCATLIEEPSARFADEELFDLLPRVEEIAFLFVSPTLARRLGLDARTPQSLPLHSVQEYLFEYSFVCEDRFYERVRIAPLFKEELAQALWVLKECAFHFEPQRLQHFSHFRPLFVDSNLEVVEFGKSDRVFILEPDPRLLPKERLFLERMAPWAKKIFISQEPLEGFHGFEEIREILYNFSFHFALVGAKSFDPSNFRPKFRTDTLF